MVDAERIVAHEQLSCHTAHECFSIKLDGIKSATEMQALFKFSNEPFVVAIYLPFWDHIYAK